jgi:hypothetical protein
MGKTAVIVMGTVVGLVLMAAANSQPPASQTSEQPAEQPAAQPVQQTCASNWRLCADNRALANSNNETYQKAKYACKAEINKKLKFGSAMWPWFAFSSFDAGSPGHESDLIKQGLADLYEPDVQFSNVYGAMVHADVTCEYSLRNLTIIGVYSNHNELLNDPGIYTRK